MRRAARLAAAVALWAAPAAAGPFDRYQLIMWQDHTPAEIAGLVRLGFTATALRATGGVVDPAALAAHVASGLPWYLENVATDLYASYHRFTPGKPVNWRFEAAQARHRAAPDDRDVFVREPGLSDPVWRERIAARLQALVREQAPYRPLFYNLADESGIADLAAAWDFDLAPASLAGFRDWLRTQYPSLGALNAEWGSDYARWDDVAPELTDAALARADANYAAWSDFKAWMDVAFARAVRAGADALHAADPAALAGLEGGQVPGWGGYDYFQLAPALDVMEIYDLGDSVALARAANPRLIVLRTSFEAGDEGAAWRSLLAGGRGMIVWDEDSIVSPDGSPKPRGAALARLVTDLGAVAPAVFDAEPVLDGVALLVSQESFRLNWLLDRRAGAPWADRDAARENEDNAWRAARRELLGRLAGLGVAPHLISSAMLETGVPAGVRVLLLPHALALSDAELLAVRRFAAAGGTVLADTEPGLFDGHGRRRPAPPRAGLAKIPDAMLRTGLAPDAGSLEQMAALLAEAGVVPGAVVRTPEGARAAGVEVRWFRRGEDTLLSLQASPPAAAAIVDLILPAPRRIADLRHLQLTPVVTAQLRVQLDRAAPTLLQLSR